MTSDDDEPVPIFSAVTSSARQIFSLLKCCGFQQKAQIELSSQGLRVIVEDSRVMQGAAFVEKNLFSSYAFNPHKHSSTRDDDTAAAPAPTKSELPDEEDHNLVFGISLAVLLECLQIFGAEASRDKWHTSGNGGTGTIGGTHSRSGPGAVFDQTVLRIGGTCKFSYIGQGHPLYLMLEENGIITTCELTTYEPELVEQIPLAMDGLALKLIMKAGWLHDAIQELEGSSVERLTIAASPQHPYFSLSASGPMGSTVVEFSNDKSLLQAFNVPKPTQHTYKFGLVKNAAKAMAMASKVSIRGDNHGVLSMQFMIEQEGGGTSFVDFRFLPFVADGSDDED
ncbi:Rad1/Rec1/Rad17 [Trichophaea hybrida]|nr:Rad1/Rec1/Rad17 [Trichophaea hybrida]